MDETPEPPRTRRRRGRPLSPALSREAIADAALAVARTEGYEGLTMAAVGRRLGVAPSALYNHIRGKHELLVLLQDAVMGEVSLTELEAAIRGEAPVVAALRAWARSYRDVFAAHPPLIPLIATLPIEGAPSTQRVYETVCAVLARVIALESFIYGSAYDVDAPADIFEVAGAQERLPALGAAAEAFRAGGGTRATGARNPYADAPFEEGLDLLLAGLGD